MTHLDTNPTRQKSDTTVLSRQDVIVDLNDGWTLERSDREISIPVCVPFDVHSSLFHAGEISDPYWRATEVSLDWIHEGEWVATRMVHLEEADLGETCRLKFSVIDCISTVEVNGDVVGECRSAFVRHVFDVTKRLHVGENIIKVTFHSTSKAATDAAETYPFKVPYLEWGNRIPNGNMIRKPSCHWGWDWNIALAPIGLFDDVQIVRSQLISLDEIKVVQRHEEGAVFLDISSYGHGTQVGSVPLKVSYNGIAEERTVDVVLGENYFLTTLKVETPELWWPSGQGDQVLNDLVVELDDCSLTRKVGLRHLDLLTTPDDVGARFALAVNGREIFMKGANWIPADALPQRGTPDVVRNLLQSAVDANMNMIRIWGGGQYEADWFYDLCDELGILIWHDFMFSCNHYPSFDPDWLALVRLEARQNIRRLSSHACMALWCGDNELIGALNWFPETKENRDRYLANYVILNHALGEVVHQEKSDVPFWPSSPSSGYLNFGDAWHDDRSGDMHFWDVWHSGKDFEHYRTVKPRFCSEFGFQSFPSMPTIERFTEPGDRNISSAVMDAHQRSPSGNSRIIETIARYFKFPDSFEDLVYLSQVSQALAMKTSIEFWRAQTPLCMGTLYWQLNDTWPVASWSSIEHGGAWKLCHYLAREFYAPVLVTAQPDAETGEIVVYAVSDVAIKTVSLTISLTARDIYGGGRTLADCNCVLPYNQSIEIARLPADAVGDTEFVHIQWMDTEKEHIGENTYFPKRYKAYDLPKATIAQEWVNGNEGPALRLTTDVPAYYVVAGLGEGVTYAQGGFLLLPEQPKTITAKTKLNTSQKVGLHHLNKG